jgi:hypothetical protein
VIGRMVGKFTMRFGFGNQFWNRCAVRRASGSRGATPVLRKRFSFLDQMDNAQNRGKSSKQFLGNLDALGGFRPSEAVRLEEDYTANRIRKTVGGLRLAES